MFYKVFTAVIIIMNLHSEISFSQNYNWINPNTTYLKLYVVNEGLIRISKNDFTNSGINTAVINPKTVKLFHNGIQKPVYFKGEEDEIFNDGDYLDFFGERNYGGIENTYDQNNILAYSKNEYYNLYSDTNVYWLGWGGEAGIRFANSNFTSAVLYSPDFYFDKLHIEQDKLYHQGESISVNDFRYLNTEIFLGEGWYKTLLSSEQITQDTFSLPALSGITQNVTLKLFAYPLNMSESISNEHTLEIYVNSTLVSTISRNDFDRIDTTINFSSILLSSGSVNNISAKYVSAVGFGGNMFFDFFEINYPKSFRFTNKIFTSKLSAADTTSKLFRVKGYKSISSLNIFDVKNNIRITNFTVSSDTLKFTAKNNAHIEIVNDSVRNKPVRIKQRSVPDLVSATNGADYIIIYNSLFQEQAEQLRTYRQSTDNFRSVKTEIEDIYDIFNFGVEDPLAVRNFTKYIYEFWQLPKLKYICLFGRGSLDPKKNSSSSSYYKNYIPVYGNPNSDGYFGNFNLGSFFYYDQIPVGRLPAYNTTEAQTLVDKILAYENEQPDKYWKTFTYITGGSNYFEQQSFQQRSNFETTQYITGTPVSGVSAKVYRTDTSGSGTFNYADSIKNTINRGTLFVNFRGHAGSHDWEVGMTDPNTLSNGNKLPVVLSLTCFTGENAKTDLRGFGEKFMYLPGKGSIGFLGTTGWSFASAGNDFGTYFIQSLKIDSTRRLGDFMKVIGKNMSFDSSFFPVRHTVNCYNLLGDPAVKIKIPKNPEFVIGNSDYKLSPESITLNEPVTLKITPKNYGLYADTCRIRFELKKNNLNYLTKDTLYRAFRYTDTLLYRFTLDTPGVYTMKVLLDANNRYPQEIESNNVITFNVPYSDYAFQPILPVNNSVVYKNEVTLRGLNPMINYSANTVKVFIQTDTSKLFNSPVLQTFINNNISGVDTKFNMTLSILNNNTIYYWRTNSIINNDTTGWTKTMNFVYNNGIVTKDEVTEQDRFIGSNTIVDISKFNSSQYSESDFINTSQRISGIRLNEYDATLFVRSYGSNADEASYFSVGNRNVYIDGGQNAGINILKVKKVNGIISGFRNLKMNSASSSDSLLEYLNTFDSTYYLMLLNAAYVENGTFLTAGAKNKLRQFGSVYCDSIGLMSYFHTWSFIGSLGASASQRSEMFDPCCRPVPFCASCDHWTQSVSSMNVKFLLTSGSISNIIGPAKEWHQFKWNSTLPLHSSILFDIIGIDRNGNQVLLRSGISTDKFVELSSINAVEYPKLNLQAKFSLDTVRGMESPVFNSLEVKYSPAVEMIIDRNSLVVNSATDKKAGVNFSFLYNNSGYAYINDAVINLYRSSVSVSNLVLSDTIAKIIKNDSSYTYSNSFIPESNGDSLRYYITIKPKDSSNEFYYYNNTADFRLGIGEFISAASITIQSEGRDIKDGDFLSSSPELTINYSGINFEQTFGDTSLIKLLLNGNYLPYYLNGKSNIDFVRSPPKDASSQDLMSLNLNPHLTAGKNILKVIYLNSEGELNSDTASFDLFVSGDNAVKDFYNYPNPMKDGTDFIFNLEGFDSEYIFRIRIYTVSGRLIKEIQHSATPGINSISWDGKDNDGEFIANGTYFYKLVSEDESFAGQKVQKLVILK